MIIIWFVGTCKNYHLREYIIKYEKNESISKKFGRSPLYLYIDFNNENFPHHKYIYIRKKFLELKFYTAVVIFFIILIAILIYASNECR